MMAADQTTSTIVEPRFEFGANWSRFVPQIDEERIQRAEASLQEMLGVSSLATLRFLDIGSGSGLFSLAAHRLGAVVTSFDYDPLAVRCTEEVRRRFAGTATSWTIGQGSVLDNEYMRSLRSFDIVYSWGVLHHTGAMWTALEHAAARVVPGGLLYIAIYNDQGKKSEWWRRIKWAYTRLPRPLKYLYALAFGVAFELAAVATAIVRFDASLVVKRWTRYDAIRGMSRWRDLVDWIGGYPYEVASQDAVEAFCRGLGFSLRSVKTCGSKLGCNEFVFERAS
jgi:2-polyprenyl-3-methyl-5-hydroxy-6-metoxy-1,4-benzoquinol methylase